MISLILASGALINVFRAYDGSAKIVICDLDLVKAEETITEFKALGAYVSLCLSEFYHTVTRRRQSY